VIKTRVSPIIKESLKQDSRIENIEKQLEEFQKSIEKERQNTQKKDNSAQI